MFSESVVVTAVKQFFLHLVCGQHSYRQQEVPSLIDGFLSEKEKMDFSAKIFFYFLVLGGVETFAKLLDDYSLTTSCYVQHLHKKGRLDEPLPSTM